LLGRFPDLLDDVPDAPKTVARCPICGHEQRHEIERSLDNGMSCRDAETTFGVSRSAIARHKSHSMLTGIGSQRVAGTEVWSLGNCRERLISCLLPGD
jgi:hypothetical protein